jgi:hypothetical protein
MTTYRADVTFPSLGEALEVLSRKLPAIANRLLGPIVSFEGISAGSYLEIARYLPAAVETEVTLEGDPQSLEEARTRLGRLQKNDRVMCFVADHGAVEVQIDDNGVATIVCDFTSPMNSADESKPIPFDELLKDGDRKNAGFSAEVCNVASHRSQGFCESAKKASAHLLKKRLSAQLCRNLRNQSDRGMLAEHAPPNTGGRLDRGDRP